MTLLRSILFPAVLLGLSSLANAQQAADQSLGETLSRTYNIWRQAMVTKDARAWDAITASHRKMEVRNRLVSEKRTFPAAVFEVPVPPPSLQGLKLMHLSKKGLTAKAGYYGPVNFGVGGDPPKNVLVLSFVGEGGHWKYDRADFVNLTALEDVRDELDAGDTSYFKETPECQATGVVPQVPLPMPGAKYIAKVYVFCPGREVEVHVNGISQHTFKNAKEAEIILGGARDGENRVLFKTKNLEGGTGKEAIAIRVYLLSQIQGQKPIIAYEYVAQEGEPVEVFAKDKFTVDADTAKLLIP